MTTVKAENSFVSIKYTVRLESGEIVKGDPERGLAHLEFFTGYNQVLPALERGLIGAAPGDRVELEVAPEEAFGTYDPGLVKEKNFAEFPEGRHLEVGRWVRATNPRHLVSFGYKVLEKKEDRVILDYNHPLAGKKLLYNIKVEEVRDATPEELALLKPCEYGSLPGGPSGH